MKAFVSYAAADRDWARELCKNLVEVEVEAWIDADELLPGDNWHNEIGRALDRSDALLVLVSAASVRSESLQRDVQFALGSEKLENRVVPVIVEPADQMPWILRKFPAASGTPAEAARRVAQILSSSPQTTRARSR